MKTKGKHTYRYRSDEHCRTCKTAMLYSNIEGRLFCPSCNEYETHETLENTSE